MIKTIDTSVLTLEMLDAFLSKPHASEGILAALEVAPAVAQPLPVGYVETIGGYPDQSAHVARWMVPHSTLKDGDRLYKSPPSVSPEIIRQLKDRIIVCDCSACAERNQPIFEVLRVLGVE